MRIPFWFPAAWIGVTLWLVPTAPWLTLLGYHAVCLAAARRPAALGRIPRSLWWATLATGVGVGLILRAPHASAPGLPTAGAQAFLATWPGGLPSYAAYTLTVNSVCEEVFWRRALVDQHPTWGDARHGLAFGLHHLVGNLLVFGTGGALFAFGYTSLGGWAAQKVARRCQGLGAVMLGHSLVNALSFAWLATRL